MKEKIKKTNAARLLDKAKIPYELVAYPIDPDDLSAVHVAEVLGEDPKTVYKTLVLRSSAPTGHFVCVVPADAEINLKLAAKAAGVKKADLIPLKELLPLTGYIRGGCTAVGMKNPFPVFFDLPVLNLDSIFVSAGQRGLQLKINPRQLIDYLGANTAHLT